MNTTQQITCPNCNGKGEIKAFAHVDGGICYKCDGEGNLGEMAPDQAAELASTLTDAARYNFDTVNAPYCVTREFLPGDVNFFYDLGDAVDFVVECRRHPKINGQVSLTHRDGRPVTRGEVRAAGR